MVANANPLTVPFQNALEVAQFLYSRGITPLPVVFGEKRPAVGNNWQRFQTTSEELAQYFGGQCNVGILLGDASGKLVDIDLDCDEAVELAPQFLPPTVTSGRFQKPNSHYWYRLAETDETPRTERFQDPTDQSVIVEIRGNGSQTAVWGQHPTGDWYYPPQGEMTTIGLEHLREAVQGLHAGVLQRRGIDPVSSARCRPDLQERQGEDPDYNPHGYTHLNEAGFREHRGDIVDWLNQQEPCIEGQGGDTRLFSVACQLCHGWNLSYAQTYTLLREVFNPRCVPLWDDSRLRYKAMQAWTAEALRPRGYLLRALRRPAYEIQFDEAAEVFLHGSAVEGIPGWVVMGDQWWRWTEKGWNPVETSVVGRAVTRFLRDRYKGTKKSHCENVIHHLGASAELQGDIRLPCWLPGTEHLDWDPKDCFVSRSEILNLQAMLSGQTPYRIASTPAFFGVGGAAYEIPPFEDAPRPARWLQFVEEVFEGDQASANLLQEWLGYLLTNDNSFQKILFLIGEKRGGKGTILNVVRMLLGENSVVASSLNELNKSFGLSGWLGKKAALFGDVRLGNRYHVDRGLIVERLISVSGGDAVEVDLKHKASISAVLNTRMTMASNSTLSLSDGYGALSSRFLYLHFPVSFLGREDRGLMDQLQAELGSIWWWAYCGLCRLYTNGRFTQPEASREAAEDQAEEMSPVLGFVRERIEDCRIHPNPRNWHVTFDNAYQVFIRWCEQRRIGPFTYTQFKRQLPQAIKTEFGIVESERVREGQRRETRYFGLHLQ
jgi:P4 family phage/plasmid primase-like protien